MCKVFFLVLMMLLPSVANGQQIIRGGVSTFGDNETNRTLTEYVSLTDTSNVLFTKSIDVVAMEAKDSMGHYNYQLARIGIHHNDGNNNIFIVNAGAERLYASTSGERYQPIGYFAMGVSPTWSNTTPFGIIAYGRYAAFDEIGQYIRADIQTTSIGTVMDVYYRQNLWIQGIVDQSYLSDDNERFTADVVIRKFTQSGFFYGGRVYYRTYEFDAGTLYWSPEQYGQFVGQVGHKFKWNDPLWQGDVVLSAGVQRQDSFNATFLGTIAADVSRKIGSRTWIRGWGGYSNGSAITGAEKGYRSWSIGLGVRGSL